MRRNRIVFWLGEPSPHQSSWLDALAELLPRHTLTAVFQRPLQAERLALGWRSPRPARMEAIMSPDAAEIDALAEREPETSVHIFGGMRLPMVERALKTAAGTEALIGIASETRSTDGWRGPLRLLHSHFVERPYRKRVDFVLAIGSESAHWYRRCGYPHRVIFPWAYVVEPPPEIRRDGRDASSVPVISYVGRCIAIKGIDTLLRALALLRNSDWVLRIVGEGSVRPQLQTLAEALQLASRVRFLGARDNTEVWRVLGETDVLVLPSRIDGWGAVVNEALMSGTPVVCSDRCGAADLVRSNGVGETFTAGSVDALACVLLRWIAKGPLPEERRRAIRGWSSCITGEALARYLVRIIDHVEEESARPIVPWLDAGTMTRRSVDDPAMETAHAQLG